MHWWDNGYRPCNSLKLTWVIKYGVVIRKQDLDNIMTQLIEPTNDAGDMVANRIEPVLASPVASIYGQKTGHRVKTFPVSIFRFVWG